MAQLVWPLRAHVMCVLTCLCVLCQQGEIQWCDDHKAHMCVLTCLGGCVNRVRSSGVMTTWPSCMCVDMSLSCVNRVRSSGVTTAWPSCAATRGLTSCAAFTCVTSSPHSSAQTPRRDSPRSVAFAACDIGKFRWGGRGALISCPDCLGSLHITVSHTEFLLCVCAGKRTMFLEDSDSVNIISAGYNSISKIFALVTACGIWRLITVYMQLHGFAVGTPVCSPVP